jgi:hypothetical protein
MLSTAFALLLRYGNVVNVLLLPATTPAALRRAELMRALGILLSIYAAEPVLTLVYVSERVVVVVVMMMMMMRMMMMMMMMMMTGAAHDEPGEPRGGQPQGGVLPEASRKGHLLLRPHSTRRGMVDGD